MRFVPGSSPSSGTSMTMGDKYSRFIFEGDRVKFFHGGRVTDFITAQPNDLGNCGGGCGIAGASMTDKA
jgi:hypothetical protein